jgi:hypothetical protein
MLDTVAFLLEIRSVHQVWLDLLRGFQTSPPMMGTWNSGLENSKFAKKLELRLPKIQFHGILWR